MKISKSPFGKYCVIKSDLGGDTFQKLSGLPGYKKWVGRDMLFDPTGASISYINNNFPEAEWSEDTKPIVDKYIESLKQAQETRENKDKDLPANDDFKFKTKPFS